MRPGNDHLFRIGKFGGASKRVPSWLKPFSSGILNGTTPPAVLVVSRWSGGGIIPLGDLDFNRTDLFIYITDFTFSWNSQVTTAGSRTHRVSQRRTNSNNTSSTNTTDTVQSTFTPLGSCPYRVNYPLLVGTLKYALRTSGGNPFLDRLEFTDGTSGGIISPTLCGGVGDRGRMIVSGYYETKDKPLP
jgi:hypothetical protein